MNGVYIVGNVAIKIPNQLFRRLLIDLRGLLLLFHASLKRRASLIVVSLLLQEITNIVLFRRLIHWIEAHHSIRSLMPRSICIFTFGTLLRLLINQILRLLVSSETSGRTLRVLVGLLWNANTLNSSFSFFLRLLSRRFKLVNILTQLWPVRPYYFRSDLLAVFEEHKGWQIDYLELFV